ncbi:hypothetical protein MHU86_11617 [Fragilaria crotonensis]|nr:hypothetical protein MHU86_11617 [Fragilaria crotonensis]
MKAFCVAFSSFLLTFGDVAAQLDGTSSQLLNGTQTNKHRRASNHPCVALLSDKDYSDHHVEDQPLECELQATDVVNATEYTVVKVKGMTTKWARKNAVKSGVTTLFASNSVIDDSTDELIIPPGETIKLGHRKKKSVGSSPMSGSGSLGPFDAWNRNLASVVKRVLVLRIQAADASTTASESQLEDDVFGAAGDVLNLKSQYNQCSYGQLQFEPTTSNTIVGTDGVYTVSLPSTFVSGAADNPLPGQQSTKLREAWYSHKFADHVIVCMPPGTSGGWIAYGYLNQWLSVFNNEWCGYPSGLLHELGHNMNLAHSSEESKPYGDQSCLMGYSYKEDDSPAMCFNGPKTWQLGWFSDYHVDLPNASGISWTGSLVGFAEKANAAPTDKMIIRIQGSVNDTYVSFNRRIGINSGTKKGADEVLVAIRATGLNYALSYLVAKLSGNGIYSVPNFNGSTSTLRIIVNSIDTNTIPSRANVSIDLVTPRRVPPMRLRVHRLRYPPNRPHKLQLKRQRYHPLKRRRLFPQLLPQQLPIQLKLQLQHQRITH